MKIFINQHKAINISSLLDDPSLHEALSIWGQEGIVSKSAIDLSHFTTPFGSISLLYGPRQIGKTASLKLFLSRLQDSETLVFTDCSTILNKADLAQHLAALIQGKTTIALDEVQSVPDWHLALRSLYAEGKLRECRVWCTGSEARYLLESGERLPGRKGEGKTIFARPWSFREYMDFFHRDAVSSVAGLRFQHVSQAWLDEQRFDWSEPWRNYMHTGGVPHAIGLFIRRNAIPDTLWRVYLDWILGTWSKVRTAEVSQSALARRICETLNSRVSYEALKKGTDIQSSNTVKALLDLQEDHFALQSVTRFDPQRNKPLPTKMKKIYPTDIFFARVWAAIGWNVRRLYAESIPTLHLDECAFLCQMQRTSNTSPVNFVYSDQTKAEVDFYFEQCGFELKSGGNPTKNQKTLLANCPQSFVIKKAALPLMAYLVGEGRSPQFGVTPIIPP